MAPLNVRRVFLLYFCLFALISFTAGRAEDQNCQDVHSFPVKILLPTGSLIESSPGLKILSDIACERICITGLGRFQHLNKYAHSRKVTIQYSDRKPITNSRKIELCIHRNASLGLGQCPHDQWKTLEKGLWSGIMSPYETKFIDIRMPSTLFGSLTISVEEEFQPYRLVFLALALLMLAMAPVVSKWVPFYYSSAMTFGIIVVILLILFQAMKLLPTGRKSTVYIFLYGSVVGLGSVILRYLSGVVHSILQQLGFGEEVFNPVAVFLLLCIIFTGAWVGFWGVRKLVLSEDGTVDTGISQFVAWAIRIVASVLILQSSSDSLLALLMLIVGVILTSALMHKGPMFWHSRQREQMPEFKQDSPEHVEHSYPNNSWSEFLNRTPTRAFKLPRSQGPTFKGTPDLVRPSLVTTKYTPPISYMAGSPLVASKKTPSARLRKPGPSPSFVASENTPSSDFETDEQDYYSVFHKTPERKHFSKEEWEVFTKDSTKKALKELVSTPEFRKWTLDNADKLMLTPEKNRGDTQYAESGSEVDIKQEHSRGGGGWFGW